MVNQVSKAVRTCKVTDTKAVSTQSQRVLHPNNIVCIPWHGMDHAGRNVCQDSFYTKSAGCHSAVDRVNIEGEHRPKYGALINNADGINGEVYHGAVGHGFKPHNSCSHNGSYPNY